MNTNAISCLRKHVGSAGVVAALTIATASPALASTTRQQPVSAATTVTRSTLDNNASQCPADQRLIAQEFAGAAKARNSIKIHPIRTYSGAKNRRNVGQGFGRSSQLRTVPLPASVQNVRVELPGKGSAD